MPNKHTAILPDWTVAKRTSQNRIYPYCVAVRESFDYAYEQAANHGNLKVHESNYRYACELAEQGASHRHAAYQTPEKQAENERVAAMSLTQYRAELTGKAIESVLEAKAKGFYDSWGVVGWNGRRDLAERLAASERAKPRNAEVVILETTIA